MTDRTLGFRPCEPECVAEIARLNKIITVLMDRAERSASAQETEFGLFQTAVTLEQQVRKRTGELEDALRENERITRSLRESEAKFRGVVSQSLVGIVLIQDGKMTYANPRFQEIFGYGQDEIRRMGPHDFAAPSDRDLVAENIRRRASGEIDQVAYEFRGVRSDGSVVDIECYGNQITVGGRPLLISLIMDVSERKRAERELQALQEALRDQSTHDALTGLHNRRYLQESLTEVLARAETISSTVTVIMIDLDHFKEINDTIGHVAGDEVLRACGALLKRSARAHDVSCRYGGEEFLLVLPGVTVDTSTQRAEQLRSAIEAARIEFGGRQIAVSASVGVATFPRDGRTGDELIAAADAALYAAKAAGRNRVVISSTIVTAPTTHVSLSAGSVATQSG
jgi:diguanylate cyclase (GGDEF)-like protein/PAS domain S-box-containing protein